MKKPIKLAVSLIICGMMFLSGCASAPDTSLPGELLGKETGYPQTLNIIAPYFFWDGNAAGENARTAGQQWVDEMSARYGVNINVISNSFAEDGTFKSAFSGVDKKTFSGLAQAESIAYLQEIVNSDLALPLDEYLADNAVWNALPEELKSTFKVNGHIYAVPANVEDYMYSRVFQKDAVDRTGITVTDLQSLKEFAAAYAKASGNYTIIANGNNDIADILNAFGLYYGEGPKNPIGYDPSEDCFTDFLTKGNAVGALEYLRELYTAGGLKCGFNEYKPKDSDEPKPASTKSLFGYNNSDDSVEVLTLNPQYPQVLFNQVFGFYMTKSTVQPKETINFFVDMMYGSEQSYLDCWLGSSSGYTLNSDGTITVKMAQNSDGSYVVPAAPNLTGGFSGVFPHSDADVLYSQNGIVTEASGTEAGKKNKAYKGLRDALDKGVAVRVPPAYSMINCPAYYSNYIAFCSLYETCIQDAVTSANFTVQQIIDDYKKEMLNLGGNQMLDEMNAAIGKKTAYYYG